MPETPAPRGLAAVHEAQTGRVVTESALQALDATEEAALQADWTAGEAAAVAAAVVEADRVQALALRDALTAALRDNDGQDALDALQIQVDGLYQVCRELKDAVEQNRVGSPIGAPLFEAAEAKIAAARNP